MRDFQNPILHARLTASAGTLALTSAEGVCHNAKMNKCISQPKGAEGSLSPAVWGILRGGRQRPTVRLREAERYFQRFRARPITLAKLKFMEGPEPEEVAA